MLNGSCNCGGATFTVDGEIWSISNCHCGQCRKQSGNVWASAVCEQADIDIKGNRIVGIGKAGNPDMMKGVDPNMIVGATTDVIAGEKLILTAGGIDTHVHWIWYVNF